MDLKTYDLEGKELEAKSFNEKLLPSDVSEQMVKDYIVAIRNNKRQWSANTKERSEVKCTSKKPHPQKGTGKARQGYLAAAQFKGGGIVFGPKPKFNQKVKVNRKEKRKAVRFLFGEKIKAGAVSLLKTGQLSDVKTKQVALFLEKRELKGKRVLFLGGSEDKGIQKALSNIEKSSFLFLPNVNGYELMLSSHLVITESHFKALESLFAKEEK